MGCLQNKNSILKNKIIALKILELCYMQKALYEQYHGLLIAQRFQHLASIWKTMNSVSLLHELEEAF